MSMLISQDLTPGSGSRRRVSPRTGGKMSKQEALAERLLARIESGEWPADTLLTEPQLMEEEGESRFVVRGALEILRRAGWVESLMGVGTRVITRDGILIDASSMQDLDVRERADMGDQDALGASVAAAGHNPTAKFRLVFVTGREEAEVARYLGVGDDETLTLRELRRSVNEQPRIIESGYFPDHIASRPELARIRKPVDVAEGTTLYLARNGFPDLCHFDDVDTRPPTKDERDFLETDQQVLVQYRITFDRLGGSPIRVIRLVYRGDRYRLRYFVDGRGNPTLGVEEKA